MCEKYVAIVSQFDQMDPGSLSRKVSVMSGSTHGGFKLVLIIEAPLDHHPTPTGLRH